MATPVSSKCYRHPSCNEGGGSRSLLPNELSTRVLLPGGWKQIAWLVARQIAIWLLWPEIVSGTMIAPLLSTLPPVFAPRPGPAKVDAGLHGVILEIDAYTDGVATGECAMQIDACAGWDDGIVVDQYAGPVLCEVTAVRTRSEDA